MLAERVREAAVDTGALEGLYPADRGFTMSVALGEVSLDQAERDVGGNFRRNYEAQVAGFELAQDAVTQRVPVSEALVRELQRTTCAGQGTHVVLTEVGPQEQDLVLGEYKQHPNHVERMDGSFHAYAPVDRVGDEMHRLIGEMSSERFLSAHCVLQAAYAHHAFTAIHPFADGNGRTARLLASIWLLRGASIPLWIRTDEKDAYLDALRSADRGDTSRWVEMVAAASLSLLRDLTSSIQFGVAPTTSEAETLFKTPAQRLGISDQALADAGEAVRSLLADAIFEALEVATLDFRQVEVARSEATLNQFWQLASDLPGARAKASREGMLSETEVAVFTTTSGDRLATVRIQWRDHSVEFSLDEVHPLVRSDASRRIRSLAGAVARWLIEDLARQLRRPPL